MTQPNIALIGARGAGKSKISRKLTKLLQRQIFSTDSLISYEADGDPISSIVENMGWTGFRDMEHQVLEKLSAMKNIIIDCGGGILVEAPGTDGKKKESFSERKAQLLKNRCTVVYLERPMKYLMDKGKLDANRPELSKDYKALLERRLPWYENAADITVSLVDVTVKEAAEKVVEKLAKKNLI
jgi:shikimate kinase